MKRQYSNVALICGGAAVILGMFMLMMLGGQKDKVSQLTIGTYGEHVYTYTFNHKEMTFTLKDKVAAHNASYAIAAEGDDAKEYIYAVSEDGDGSGVYSFERGKEGTVQTGHWQQTGADPCFALLFDEGRYMMTADYSGGSISAFPINKEFIDAQEQYATSAETILSCGPYILKSWTPGYSYELELNKDFNQYDEYVAAGTANKVVFRVLEDTQTALMEYEAGNLDTVILSGEQVTANEGVEGFVNRLQGYLFYLSININHYGE